MIIGLPATGIGGFDGHGLFIGRPSSAQAAYWMLGSSTIKGKGEGLLPQELTAITVGIDDSEPALFAARWAARDAALRGVRLRLIHIADREEDFTDVVADRLTNEFPKLSIESVHRGGSPTKVLLDESEHSLLTVVGATGANRISGAFFGSVAARVAAHGQGRIVVARPTSTATQQRKPGPVVVGVDGSAAAEAAIGFAYEEAALRGARLVAIHTWNNKPLEHALGSYPLEINAGEVDEQERQLLEAALEGWEHKYPQVDVDQRIIRGRAAPTLLRYAAASESAAAQLLVVGSRGRGGFAGLLLGSTSQAVLTHAECSVAIVHN